MQRMSPLDATFFRQDSVAVPRQIASLAIVENGDNPLTYDRLVQAIDDRIGLVPRYRQVARRVPRAIGTPFWVDDEYFDISAHVRRSALPKPGSMSSLRELVGRLIARRLDLERPLWELYLVEGLSKNRSALVFKAHQSLVDGSETVDLAQVLLESAAHERDIPREDWKPRHEPGPAGLVLESLSRNLRRPTEAVRIAEMNVGGGAARVVPALANKNAAPAGILSTELAQHRRFASLETNLDDFRLVRDEHGGTVNDVILAAIAGGMRGWMLTRAEAVTSKTRFRAMVPMSVVSDDGLPTSFGSTVRGHLLSLPVGETNPVIRLHQVSYALKGHRETGLAVNADKLASLPGFTPSTFHAVGARVADAESGRGHQVVITNVPGPQDPVYVAGNLVKEVYPCIPLSDHRAVAIGVTSYNKKVYFGIVADRDAVPDADVLAQCIEDAVVEMVETVGPRRTHAPRGRQRPSKS